MSRAASGPTTSWRASRRASCGTARPATCARTTAPSSRRQRCGPGSAGWASRHASSNPAVPGRTGSVEACNGKCRDECLTLEIFTTLTEAQVLIARWRREYNQVRPHSARGSRPPAPEALAIGLPHPTPWAVRRVPVLTSRVAQRSGAGHPPQTAKTPLSPSGVLVSPEGDGETKHPRRTPALRLLSSPAYLRARESRWNRRTCLQRRRRAVLRWPRGLRLLRHGL